MPRSGTHEGVPHTGHRRRSIRNSPSECQTKSTVGDLLLGAIPVGWWATPESTPVGPHRHLPVGGQEGTGPKPCRDPGAFDETLLNARGSSRGPPGEAMRRPSAEGCCRACSAVLPHQQIMANFEGVVCRPLPAEQRMATSRRPVSPSWPVVAAPTTTKGGPAGRPSSIGLQAEATTSWPSPPLPPRPAVHRSGRRRPAPRPRPRYPGCRPRP